MFCRGIEVEIRWIKNFHSALISKVNLNERGTTPIHPTGSVATRPFRQPNIHPPKRRVGEDEDVSNTTWRRFAW